MHRTLTWVKTGMSKCIHASNGTLCLNLFMALALTLTLTLTLIMVRLDQTRTWVKVGVIVAVTVMTGVTFTITFAAPIDVNVLTWIENGMLAAAIVATAIVAIAVTHAQHWTRYFLIRRKEFIMASIRRCNDGMPYMTSLLGIRFCIHIHAYWTISNTISHYGLVVFQYIRRTWALLWTVITTLTLNNMLTLTLPLPWFVSVL